MKTINFIYSSIFSILPLLLLVRRCRLLGLNNDSREQLCFACNLSRNSSRFNILFVGSCSGTGMEMPFRLMSVLR